jgi:hypothetical protein
MSTNDKTKLDGVETGAQVNVATNLGSSGTGATRTITSSTGTSTSITYSAADLSAVPTSRNINTSGIATGGGNLTADRTINVPATNLTYTTAATTGTVNSSTGTNATIPAATTSLAGLMTDADKTKLDGIAAGAQVNVATNLGNTVNATSVTVTSSTGNNTTLPAATTTNAGVFVATDKTKLNGIEAGAQVNVGTNLSVTGGTTAGPTINSSTGTNVTLPTASGTASGVVTTNAQTFAGTKTFSAAVVLSTAGTTTTQAVRADRTITTGTGLTGGGNLTANRTFSIDSTVATLTGTQTLTNKTLTSPEFTGAIYANGSYRGNVVAVSALDIDVATGNYFTKSLSASSTFTFSNTPASRAASFILRVSITGNIAITWPTEVEFPKDEAPTLTADKTHLFMFATDNGGTTWRGAFLADYEA